MAREAQSIGCETAQVFTRSPRGGPARPIDPEQATAMRATLGQADIAPLIVHVPYFVAPASERDDLGQLAIDMVNEDCHRAATLGAPYVVVHAGYRRQGGPAQGVAAVVERLGAAARAVEAHPATGGQVQIVLENGAGGRGDAAGSLAMWAECLLTLHQLGLPVGGCLDTAHLWGAGWQLGVSPAEISDPATQTWAPGAATHLLDTIERAGVLRLLRVLHLNDSAADYGSHRDRHEHIGRGRIPMSFFAALLGDPRVAGIPGIVETDPAAGGVALDLETLRLLRRASSTSGGTP